MILLSTGSLYTQPVARVFAWAAEAGFDGMELLVDARPETRDREHLRRCIEAEGLPVPVVHVPFHSQPPPEWGEDSIGRVLATARLAGELGAGLVVVHLPLWHERDFARWLEEELPRAEQQTGLTLAVENLPAYRWFLPQLGIRRRPFLVRERPSGGPVGALLRRVTRPDKRFNTPEELARFEHLVFDTTHWARRGDVLAFWEKLHHRVVHIHVANYRRGSGHRLPWDGDIDIRGFIRLARRGGYRGHFTAELCPQALGDPEEATVRQRLSETARWLRRADPGPVPTSAA